jgi:hypothetical protein
LVLFIVRNALDTAANTAELDGAGGACTVAAAGGRPASVVGLGGGCGTVVEVPAAVATVVGVGAAVPGPGSLNVITSATAAATAATEMSLGARMSH